MEKPICPRKNAPKRLHKGIGLFAFDRKCLETPQTQSNQNNNKPYALCIWSVLNVVCDLCLYETRNRIDISFDLNSKLLTAPNGPIRWSALQYHRKSNKQMTNKALFGWLCWYLHFLHEMNHKCRMTTSILYSLVVFNVLCAWEFPNDFVSTKDGSRKKEKYLIF